MGRRPLCRRVSYLPLVTYFKPAGIPLRELEEVCLSVEEVEAIRLKDIEDLEQEQCAARMNVSRPTFVRILDAARKKTARALIEGKAIRIEGGNFEITQKRFKCTNGHEWGIPLEKVESNTQFKCPICDTTETLLVSTPEAAYERKSRCHRKGSGWPKPGHHPEEMPIVMPNGTGEEIPANQHD
jgi:uncharacterized protein